MFQMNKPNAKHTTKINCEEAENLKTYNQYRNLTIGNYKGKKSFNH